MFWLSSNLATRMLNYDDFMLDGIYSLRQCIAWIERNPIPLLKTEQMDPIVFQHFSDGAMKDTNYHGLTLRLCSDGTIVLAPNFKAIWVVTFTFVE